MGSVEALTRTQLASPFRTALIDLCFEARLRRRRHRGPLPPRRSRSCHLRGPLRRPRGLLLSDLPQRARALPSPGRSRSHRARRLAGPPARHRLRALSVPRRGRAAAQVHRRRGARRGRAPGASDRRRDRGAVRPHRRRPRRANRTADADPRHRRVARRRHLQPDLLGRRPRRSHAARGGRGARNDVLGRPPLSGRRPCRRGARDPATAAPRR